MEKFEEKRNRGKFVPLPRRLNTSKERVNGRKGKGEEGRKGKGRKGREKREEGERRKGRKETNVEISRKDFKKSFQFVFGESLDDEFFVNGIEEGGTGFTRS